MLQQTHNYECRCCLQKFFIFLSRAPRSFHVFEKPNDWQRNSSLPRGRSQGFVTCSRPTNVVRGAGAREERLRGKLGKLKNTSRMHSIGLLRAQQTDRLSKSFPPTRRIYFCYVLGQPLYFCLIDHCSALSSFKFQLLVFLFILMLYQIKF